MNKLLINMKVFNNFCTNSLDLFIIVEIMTNE